MIAPELRRQLLSAAKKYAAARIPVFPCKIGAKPPACAHGVKDATCDLGTIERWWGEDAFNIGLALEDAGLCAIDLDGLEAETAWIELQIEYGFAPETREHRTPRGRHLIYKGSLPPTASKLGLKIDTRGCGSYVVAPPSVVDGKQYVAVNDLEPAELPAWVARLLEKPKTTPEQAPVASGKPANAALIENMLRCINPASDRNAWLIVCGGLVSAPVSDPAWDGLDLFIRWSRGEFHGGIVPANFKSIEDCEAQWQRDVEKRPVR